ncbi:MAG: nucleoside recognition domain-containing protein, partial [Anaerovoracaceae bacterium]
MCINRAMTPVPAASRHKTRRLRRRRIGAAFSFAAVMSHVFIITFGPPGTFLTRSMENLTAACTEYLRARMISAGMNPPFISLVTDGVCTGTGSVLSFVPAISLLFLQLSILEHSRFMDIAAFALDGVMKKAGLSGAAAVPLLTGFGCSVPAVMASRRIPDIR